MATPDWMASAACRGMNPESFFPARLDTEQRAAALEVCAGCPVKASCLQRACDERHDGIWGGTTGSERQRQFGRGPRHDRSYRDRQRDEVPA